MPFSVLKPQDLPDDVQAFFTLKNEQWNSDREISGLNLGLNSESKEIVTENRNALLDELGIDNNSLALVYQIHSDRIIEVAAPGEYGKADGLITQTRGVTLGIKVADCAPILMADTQSDWIAAVHAGWRGAVANIHLKAIAMLKVRGVEERNLKVYIGPCISAERFEVGEEVAAQFPEEVVLRDYKKPHVDLKQFLRNSLCSSGVKESHIEIDSRCTIANQECYSYRREGDQSGRMMALIQRTL